MPWLALTLELEGSAAEAFSDALLAAGAHSVWIEAARLCALLDVDAEPARVVAAAAGALGLAAPPFGVNHVADEDWVRNSQAQFAPLTVGRRLWVGASWHEAQAGRVAVRIDPGLAFGTGSHASTRLALRFLEQELSGGERVLDYGCGSGILAIAAAKLGAMQVDAVDVDPEAVAATRRNAALNGVRLQVALADALGAAHYDIVVSNILAQPLIVLAPLLAARAGRLALSGILETQADEVARAYAPWLRMRVAAREEGWALLAGGRA
jgi:ribosomal protein L11 methyltransferase